jgi:hypothetical protein
MFSFLAGDLTSGSLCKELSNGKFLTCGYDSCYPRRLLVKYDPYLLLSVKFLSNC